MLAKLMTRARGSVSFRQPPGLPGAVLTRVRGHPANIGEHVHRRWTLCLVTEGSRHLLVPGARHHLRSPAAFALAPFVPHACAFLGGYQAHSALNLEEEMVPWALRLACAPSGCGILDPGAMESVFAELLSRDRAEDHFRCAGGASPRLASPLDRGVPDPARVSREHHAREHRARMGLPPRRYARQLALRRAAALIANGQALADVALECGFVDQSHLSRRFRSFWGVCPGEIERTGTITTGSSVPATVVADVPGSGG
jgi:hypothetical protein